MTDDEIKYMVDPVIDPVGTVNHGVTSTQHDTIRAKLLANFIESAMLLRVFYQYRRMCNQQLENQ